MDEVYTADTKKQPKILHWNGSTRMDPTGSARQPDLGKKRFRCTQRAEQCMDGPAKPALRDYRRTEHSLSVQSSKVSHFIFSLTAPYWAPTKAKALFLIINMKP